jgi:hypothetical protein
MQQIAATAPAGASQTLWCNFCRKYQVVRVSDDQATYCPGCSHLLKPVADPQQTNSRGTVSPSATQTSHESENAQ